VRRELEEVDPSGRMSCSPSSQGGGPHRLLKDAPIGELRALTAEFLREHSTIKEEHNRFQQEHLAFQKQREELRAEQQRITDAQEQIKEEFRAEQRRIIEEQKQIREEHRGSRERQRKEHKALKVEQKALKEEQKTIFEIVQQLCDSGDFDMKAKVSELSPAAVQKLNPFSAGAQPDFRLSNYEASLVESSEDEAGGADAI